MGKDLSLPLLRLAEPVAAVAVDVVAVVAGFAALDLIVAAAGTAAGGKLSRKVWAALVEAFALIDDAVAAKRTHGIGAKQSNSTTFAQKDMT